MGEWGEEGKEGGGGVAGACARSCDCDCAYACAYACLVSVLVLVLVFVFVHVALVHLMIELWLYDDFFMLRVLEYGWSLLSVCAWAYALHDPVVVVWFYPL